MRPRGRSEAPNFTAHHTAAPTGVFSYYVRLRRVWRHVHENLGDELSLARVAEVACLSEKYFSEFFREKTGVRFRDWLSAMRVERAAQLIRTTDDSLTNIAFTVGFADLRTFQRAFKRRMALTPSNYRKRVAP